MDENWQPPLPAPDHNQQAACAQFREHLKDKIIFYNAERYQISMDDITQMQNLLPLLIDEAESRRNWAFANPLNRNSCRIGVLRQNHVNYLHVDEPVSQAEQIIEVFMKEEVLFDNQLSTHLQQLREFIKNQYTP